MSGFTPGPWTAGTHQGKPAVFEDYPAVVCVMGFVDDFTRAEAEANARLIAAAPDMLAALEDVIDRLDNFVDVVDGPEGQPQPNWAMSLRAELERIEKAVG